MLASEHDDRMEAHDRVNRYYEIMGQDPPHYPDHEYRELFYDVLAKIEEGK